MELDLLEIRLMGDISLLRNGEPVDLPQSRKTIALLAYLVVTGRKHHRDRLCSLLWENPNDPRGALRWSLSKLRSLVDEPKAKRIVGDRTSVAFQLLDAKVDVLSLREFCETNSENRSIEQMKEIANSITGAFMENLELPECHEFQAWRTAEQVDFGAMSVEILTDLCGAISPETKEARGFKRSLERISSVFPNEAFTNKSSAGKPKAILNTYDGSGNIQLPEKPSIAVLPFRNLSDLTGQDYFVDGITEDLITALSRYKEFFVIARNSTFTYKDHPKDPSEISRELGVQYVLEGSVRRLDTQVRVNVQLIDGLTGTHIWAELYDLEVADILALQDDITQKIATRIGPELLAAEMSRANRTNAIDANAHEYFLRGMWHFDQYTEQDISEALRIAKEGIERYPEDAELQTVSALSNIINFIYGWKKPRLDSLELANDAAKKGVELDPFNPRIYRCMGVVDLYAKRHDDAIADLHRTIALNPNDADGYSVLGGILGYTGDYDGALRNIQKGIRLSPRETFLAHWYNYMAHAATIGGHDDVALEWADKMRREKPTFPGGHRVAAVAHIHLGHFDEAETCIQEFLHLAPQSTIEDLQLVIPIRDEPAMARYLGALRQAGLSEK